MCGIAGIIDFTGRPIPAEDLTAMRQALSHRGPDGSGQWSDRRPGFSVGLVHTRLAIIDLSTAAAQPMLDPAGRWALSYNGELYNYRQLRAELPGPWRSESDTEVVLRAWAAWGEQAQDRFDGMWALAMVDRDAPAVTLSRDPWGIKPLVYTVQNERLVFASELRALRCCPGLDWEIDPEAMHLYLHLGFVPHPRTIYRRVHKLPPGHLLTAGPSGPLPPRRYYRIPLSDEPPPPYATACIRLREAVEEAVRRQTVADVPLGAFLSGGLDSAVVVASLRGRTSGPVRTFTIGYPDHPRYDESPWARRLARHLGTEHHEFPVSWSDVLGILEPMIAHLGEPFADSSLLPVALVSRLTRGHVTVALSGDGGDELFAGYWRYRGHAALARYRRLPRLVRRGLIEPLLERLPAARSTRWMDRLRQARKLLRGDGRSMIADHLAWSCFLTPQDSGRLIGPEAARQALITLQNLYGAASAELLGRDRPAAGLEAVLLADLAVGLPGDMLFKVDIASMYYGLEVRVPLLSSDLAALVQGWPLAWRIRGGRTKRILRDAFASRLPAEFLRRPKMGFEVPVGEFLRRELADAYQDTVGRGCLCELGIDADAAADLYAAHAARRQDHTEILWALFVLCRWLRHAGGKPTTPAADRQTDS